MPNKRKININSSLFIAILLMLILKSFYSYKNIQWSVVLGSRSFEAIGITNYFTVGLNLATLLCLMFVALRVYRKNAKYFSLFFNLSLIALLFAVIGWTFVSFIQIGVKNTLYMSSSPLVYFSVLAILMGFDNFLWYKLTSLASKLAMLNIILAYYHYFSFTSVYRGALPGGNSPVMTYFIAGFWLTAVSIVGYEDIRRKKTVLIYALIISLVVLSVVIYSRGWLIQSMILLLIATFQIEEKKGVAKLLKTVFVVVYIGLTSYYILEKFYFDYLISLIAKFGNDTRSYQYVEIFRQTPIFQFIVGGGISARYYLPSYNEYSYIDNQYIFTLFRYGIFMLIPYIYFYISTAFSLWKMKIDIHKKSGLILILMWLLALGGLSVYNGIAIDIKNIVSAATVGHCLYISTCAAQKRNIPNLIIRSRDKNRDKLEEFTAIT